MVESKNSLLRPGDVFEKYTVEQELGHGGMGAVYLVRHRVLNTNFALKVLYPGVAQRDQQFVDRFIREAQLAGRIRHPNLIAVYDAGLNESNGMYYLVMDYVSGGSVRSKLRKQVHLTVLESLGIVRQVGHALEAALQHNMVHRDIKPDNIMFDADGVARLADLGIAKATGDHDANLTVEAAVFGTPAYMSPEQARDSRNVDIRADIYSLGIVLYEMLTGRRPFTGENTIEILTQVIGDTPAPDVRTLNPDIPEAVAVLVSDMIAKDLRKRVASPSDLISRIDVILSNLENSEDAVEEQPEVEKTMATIAQPVAAAAQAAELTMETVSQPQPAKAELTMETIAQPQPAPSQPQAAELTMETIAQPTPQPQSAPSQAELTMETIAQPKPAEKKASEPVANQPFEPTVAFGSEAPPKVPFWNEKNRKLIIAGGAAVGLLLVIGGGALLMKGGKEPEKPANLIESPADNSGKETPKPVETTQTNVQPPKTEVKTAPKVEEQPVQQTVVKTEPKVEEQPVVAPKVEEKVAPKVEEQPATQVVVKTEPKVETTAATAAAAIQAKIAFFGAENAENNALLKGIQNMAGEQNTTFQKAGLSSRTKGDLMKIQSGKPDLMLIAVTSRYETMSLSNFELFVADLCESLRSRGGNYAFVLEPIAGKSARFCNGNNTVRDVCRQRSINIIDCENGEIKLDDVKMLLNQ
ncbi:MAG: protein kinase [Victivallales bacterium]|nr:protein kinase [Victivallales bacterium]